MHVVLVVNTAWMEEELATLRCLTVGLIDENVRVSQLVPDGMASAESNPFGDLLTWRDSSWYYPRRRRLLRHAASLAETGVEVVHALDGRLWDGALRLADRLDAVAVLSAGSAMDVDLGRSLLGRGISCRAAVAAGTTPLADQLRSVVDPSIPVEVVRNGVHLPSDSASSEKSYDVVCGLISGVGRMDADYDALFEAIRRFIAEQPESQFFLDALCDDQHPIWQAVQRFGLLANMSVVPRQLGRRELLKAANVLIHPQSLHRCRGMTLQAMANGIPVLAREDPWLDYLVHDRTAWLLDTPSPASWHALLRRVAEQPEACRALARSAGAWVREHHPAPLQIGRVLDLYRRLTGQSLKFEHAAAI